MAHSVQLIVGRGEAVARFLARWPGARAIELTGEWQAIPLEQGLHDRIGAAHPEAQRPEQLDLSPPGLESEMAAATQGGGGLAYVETEYFGGAGEQSAIAFVDGQRAYGPARSKGGGGSINPALRSIGVQRAGSHDEFDVIGLGERRTMEDYEPAGQRRLRQATPIEAQAVQQRFAPPWLVIVVILGCIALGIMAARG